MSKLQWMQELGKSGGKAAVEARLRRRYMPPR
jgi:hypothetical protein